MLDFSHFLIFHFPNPLWSDLPSVFGPFDGHKSQITNVVDELHYTYYTVLHECALQGIEGGLASPAGLWMVLRSTSISEIVGKVSAGGLVDWRTYVCSLMFCSQCCWRCNIVVSAQLIQPWITFNDTQPKSVTSFSALYSPPLHW